MQVLKTYSFMEKVRIRSDNRNQHHLFKYIDIFQNDWYFPPNSRALYLLFMLFAQMGSLFVQNPSPNRCSLYCRPTPLSGDMHMHKTPLTPPKRTPCHGPHPTKQPHPCSPPSPLTSSCLCSSRALAAAISRPITMSQRGRGRSCPWHSASEQPAPGPPNPHPTDTQNSPDTYIFFPYALLYCSDELLFWPDALL